MVRPAESIIDLPESYWLTSYPSVVFHGDHMLVGHNNAHIDAEGTNVKPGRMIVLPVSWLYGGPERMERNGFYDDLTRHFPKMS